MSKRSANPELMKKVTSHCLYIEHDDNRRTSAVVLTEQYATAALCCIPDALRQIGLSVILNDSDRQQHTAHVHGISKICDYIVFKKTDGVFCKVPEMTYPMTSDQYIVVGFAFGEKEASVRLGHISSLSNGGKGFFYGDSGGLPGVNGGGVFYGRNGALLGIARGSDEEQYGDNLEMVSVQFILNNIEFSGHRPFSV